MRAFLFRAAAVACFGRFCQQPVQKVLGLVQAARPRGRYYM